MSQGLIFMIMTGANNLIGTAKGRYDGHAHVFETSLKLTTGTRYQPKKSALWQSYKELLLANNLDGGILVQPSFLGTDNSYLLDVLDESRLTNELSMYGVVVIDHDTDFSELLRLKGMGVIGIRLNLVSGGYSKEFKISDWVNLFRMMNDLSMHLEIYNTSYEMAKLIPVLTHHVEKLVIDHFGMPDTNDIQNDPCQRAIRLAPLGRVLVKASGPYRVFKNLPSNEAAKQCAPICQRLYDAIGPDNLLWGSDWPWTQFEDCHDFISVKKWEYLWQSKADIKTKIYA